MTDAQFLAGLTGQPDDWRLALDALRASGPPHPNHYDPDLPKVPKESLRSGWNGAKLPLL